MLGDHKTESKQYIHISLHFFTKDLLFFIMKVPSAALLFLASFGTTISSSNAKMVEFQVSSDGETNKQKKNVRKLQDGVGDGPIGDCTISRDCKDWCTELYCACAEDCGHDSFGDECINKTCAESTAGGIDLLTKCQTACAPNCNNENKLQQQTVEAKSSRAPESREVQGKRFLNDRDDEFNWDEYFQCKDVPTKSPSPSMTPSISSAPSTSTAPTTDCGIIDCDMTHSASCNPGMYIHFFSSGYQYIHGFSFLHLIPSFFSLQRSALQRLVWNCLLL